MATTESYFQLEVHTCSYTNGRQRSDSIVSVTSLSDDFLPLVSEFLMQPTIMRDRAFSWDVAVDDELDAPTFNALINHPARTRSRSGISVDDELDSPTFHALMNHMSRTRSRSGSLVSCNGIGTRARAMSINNSLMVDDIFASLDDDASSKNGSKKRKSTSSLSPLAPKKLKSLIGITSSMGMSFGDDDFDMNDFEEDDDEEEDEGEVYEFKGNENPSLTKGLRRTRQSRTATNTRRNESGDMGGLLKLNLIPDSAIADFIPPRTSTAAASNTIIKSEKTSKLPSIQRVQSSSSSSSSSSATASLTPATRPIGPLYGPEPELTVANFGPINGVVVGDGCRVGVYTKEERDKRIERFREKKLKRIWRKQIKYDCRKRLADTRPRVKGRFVSRVDEGALTEAAAALSASSSSS